MTLSKNLKYGQWIIDKIASSTAGPFNMCSEWTKEMATAFPELKRVRGHAYLSPPFGERPHWWLVEENGDIVDPTYLQWYDPYYTGAIVLDYLPWDETQPEPTGLCPNCGGLCYNGMSVCSMKCDREYMAYINGNRH